MERYNIDCLIIGGGVAGLAIGSNLSKHFDNIFIVERNYSLGQETSSRNSEVIHAGIYYKKDSLKSRLCIEGKKLLYEYIEERKIQHMRCGKFIISTSDEETEKLENILNKRINLKKNVGDVGNLVLYNYFCEDLSLLKLILIIWRRYLPLFLVCWV